MFGLTKPEDTIAIKPFQIFQKELVLKASYINPYTQKRAAGLIDSGRLDVSSMVSEVCGLERLEDILSRPDIRAKGNTLFLRKNKTGLVEKNVEPDPCRGRLHWSQ